MTEVITAAAVGIMAIGTTIGLFIISGLRDDIRELHKLVLDHVTDFKIHQTN